MGDNDDVNKSIDVKLYTYDGFAECLASKTVVFIGDSRVRYQYMHLASYLKTKKFMKCDDQSLYKPNTKNDQECLLTYIDYGGKRDWRKWFKESTSMIKDFSDNNNNASSTEEVQSSLCDCWRDNNQGGPLTSVENRYTRRLTKYGTINLVYLSAQIGIVDINHDFPPFSSFNSTSRCEPGDCSPDNRNSFTGDVNTTLWEILPRLNTTHAFINLGWEHKYPFTNQSDFTCVMEKFMQKHPTIKLHLISHPPTVLNVQSPLKMFNPNELKCKVDVLDRTTVNKNVPITSEGSFHASWYYDSVHVISILNEEYNHQLVKKICPI